MSRSIITVLICGTLLVLAGLCLGCQRPVSNDAQAGAVAADAEPKGAARASNDAHAPLSECRGRLYLVYLHDMTDRRTPGRPANQFVDTSFLEELANHHHKRYGIDARVRPPMELVQADYDPERKQFQDEHILDRLTERFSEEIADPDAVVIAVMNPDMYPVSIPQWRYAFSMRREEQGLALLSTYWMIDNPDARGDARFAHRVRVMLAKDIGRLLCGFGLSEDPHSVMYGKVLSPADLDQMSDDLRTGR